MNGIYWQPDQYGYLNTGPNVLVDDTLPSEVMPVIHIYLYYACTIYAVNNSYYIQSGYLLL